VTVAYPRQERLGVLASSLTVGAGPSSLVAIVFAAGAILVPTDVPAQTVTALAVTAAVAGFLSPAQDHVRRMFFQAGRSGYAVTMSTIQLTVVVGVIVLLDLLGTDPAWIPLGALACANLSSVTFGLLAARTIHRAGRIPLQSRSLYRTGGWLLMSGFATVGGQVVGIILTTILAGAAFAGYAQAALILAQPLLVLATGLGAVLNPDIMEAAGKGDERSARGTSRLYASLMVAATVTLAVLIGIDWAPNPLPALFPNAYAVSGLLALTIVAQGLNYSLFGNRFELIGGFAHTPMAKSTVTGSVAQIGVGAFASVLQSYTVALGIGAAVVVKGTMYRISLKRMYSGRPRETAP
jgi:O-antigen/teichoic acid export membrane protein